MATSVDVVTQEEVVVAFDITVLIGSSPEIEEPHQVLILSVDITEDLDRCIDLENHGLSFKDFLGFISQGKDVLPSEREESLAVYRCRPLLWSQKMVQEKLMERLDSFAALISLV